MPYALTDKLDQAKADLEKADHIATDEALRANTQSLPKSLS
jgi:hypothetical protein